VPLYAGDFVNTEAGTGFVHIAPGHGEDDYTSSGQQVPSRKPVGGDGTYYQQCAVCRQARLQESIPHAGGLKDAGACSPTQRNIPIRIPGAPRRRLIFRNTPQWFIPWRRRPAQEGAGGDRGDQVAAGASKNRIGAMIDRAPTGASRASANGRADQPSS